MGCPDFYYKMLLQRFAYCLTQITPANFFVDDEKSKEELEDFILEVKKDMDEKTFLFNAGWVSREVWQNVLEEERGDAINAFFNGECEFERFIGVPNEDECIGGMV